MPTTKVFRTNFLGAAIMGAAVLVSVAAAAAQQRTQSTAATVDRHR